MDWTVGASEALPRPRINVPLLPRTRVVVHGNGGLGDRPPPRDPGSEATDVFLFRPAAGFTSGELRHPAVGNGCHSVQLGLRHDDDPAWPGWWRGGPRDCCPD